MNIKRWLIAGLMMVGFSGCTLVAQNQLDQVQQVSQTVNDLNARQVQSCVKATVVSPYVSISIRSVTGGLSMKECKD